MMRTLLIGLTCLVWAFVFILLGMAAIQRGSWVLGLVSAFLILPASVALWNLVRADEWKVKTA